MKICQQSTASRNLHSHTQIKNVSTVLFTSVLSILVAGDMKSSTCNSDRVEFTGITN